MIELHVGQDPPPLLQGNGSYFSSTVGPSLFAQRYTWTQTIFPTTVGTVLVVINDDTNRTSLTTKTNTEYKSNGTLNILTRTDTNGAGTVTTVINPDGYGVTIPYPSQYQWVSSYLSWYAAEPITYSRNHTCCGFTFASSLTPTHEPWPLQSGSTDTHDPSGWLYGLTLANYGDGYYLDSTAASSLWPDTALVFDYQACTHTKCPFYSYGGSSPATMVSEAAFLLATSTVHVSGSAKASPGSQITSSSASQTSAKHTTVTVDPVQLGPSSPSRKVPENLSPSANSHQPPIESQSPSSLPSMSTASSLTMPEAPTTKMSSSALLPPSALPFSSSTSIAPASVAQSPSEATSIRPTQQSSDQGPTTAETLQSAISEPIATSPASSFAATPSSSSQDVVHVIMSVIPSLTRSTAYPTSTSWSTARGSHTTTLGQTTRYLASSTRPLEFEHLSPASTASLDAPHVINIGSSTITMESDSGFVLSGQTLGLGSSITLGSGSAQTVVAMQTRASETALAVGSSTSTLPTIEGGLVPVIVGSSTIVPDSSSNYVVAGQTLRPGSTVILGTGSAATMLALSTDESRTVVMVATQAAPYETPSDMVFGPTIVVGSSTIAPTATSKWVISGQTLQAGRTITIGPDASPTTVALHSEVSRTMLIVGTSTSELSAQQILTSITYSDLPKLTLGSSVLVPNSASEYIVGTQTLSPGGRPITFSGTTMRLASGATELIVGSNAAIATSVSGLGGYIWSGLSGPLTSAEQSFSSQSSVAISSPSDASSMKTFSSTAAGGTMSFTASTSVEISTTSGSSRALLDWTVLLYLSPLVVSFTLTFR